MTTFGSIIFTVCTQIYPATPVMNFAHMPCCLIQNPSKGNTLFLCIMSLFSLSVDKFLRPVSLSFHDIDIFVKSRLILLQNNVTELFQMQF